MTTNSPGTCACCHAPLRDGLCPNATPETVEDIVERLTAENTLLRDAQNQPPFYREMWLALVAECQVANQPDLQQAALKKIQNFRTNQPSRLKAVADESHAKYIKAAEQLDCGGKGCGTDETKACLRCCRILIANNRANHGDACDAENERLRSQLDAMTKARNLTVELAEAATFILDNHVCQRCRDRFDNATVETIDELRKVGAL